MRIFRLCLGLFAIAAIFGPRPAAAQTAPPLHLDSHCPQPVEFILAWQATDGRWLAEGKFQAPAGNVQSGSAFPLTLANGAPFRHDPARPLHIWARTTSGPSWAWQGSQRITYAGGTYAFRRAEFATHEGRQHVYLGCRAPPQPPASALWHEIMDNEEVMWFISLPVVSRSGDQATFWTHGVNIDGGSSIDNLKELFQASCSTGQARKLHVLSFKGATLLTSVTWSAPAVSPQTESALKKAVDVACGRSRDYKSGVANGFDHMMDEYWWYL